MKLIKDKKQVAKLDNNGIELEVYNSMSEASRINNISLSSISQVCSGTRQSAGGFYWKIIKPQKIYDNRPILQFNLSGNFIKRWENVEQAAKHYQIKPDNIMKNLNKETKTSNGCLWEWE